MYCRNCDVCVCVCVVCVCLIISNVETEDTYCRKPIMRSLHNHLHMDSCIQFLPLAHTAHCCPVHGFESHSTKNRRNKMEI